MIDNKQNSSRIGMIFYAQFIQKVADYLSSKPFSEVNLLMQGIQQGNVVDDTGIKLIELYLNKNFTELKNLADSFITTKTETP